MLKDFRKTQQDWEVDPPLLQPIDELLQVDACGGVFVRMHQERPPRAD
jgi:hypothetical protein